MRRRILMMTAVEAERDAVMRGLRGADHVDVRISGVGAATAAANTAKVLANGEYGLVISAGIGGGFEGRADVGSLVVADDIVAADLGAESAKGFLSVDELGFGSSRITSDREWVGRIAKALQAGGLPVHIGSVLTVSTVTGTAATAGELIGRIPDAAAEAMEGYGVAVAARIYGLPVLEIRAVSNSVGPRDRDAWRIREALEVLETASSIILEVI